MKRICARFTLVRLCGLAALGLVGFAPGTKAADATDTNYTGALWLPEPSAAILRAAADITTNHYPDSDSATVDCRSVRVYRPDGTGACQDESFVKVLTEKGRRDNRTLSLNFQLPYNTVSVPLLEVIHPDGSVSPVDVAANSKEAIDESQMAENISDPNSKVLQVNLPKVEIGDVIHSITRTTINRAIIEGHYAEENVFEQGGYIRHIAYEVHAPAARPLVRVALRDPVAGTVSHSSVTNSDGSLTDHWEVTNVPRMFDEPDMPPYDSVLQRLMVSTLPDWPTVSRWYWNLSAPHLAAVSPEMLDEVNVLTNGAANEHDKIMAIFYHVSKKVRYMGLTPEKDRPGFEPHDVKLTFAKNYGVCRDKAALLVALLRTAGIPAYPVLINIGSKRDPEVPDPDFDHAIACVQTGPGQYQLMDPTDENTRDLLPYYDCNRSYLVCRPEGENLLVSPVHPPEEHMMRVATTGELSADGTLHAQAELSFEGVNDDAYRNAFVHMKPDDLRRFFEANLKQSLPGARLESVQVHPANMLDMSENIRAKLTFSARGLIAHGNGLALVTSPWIGGRLGIVNFILQGTGLDHRKYPLLTSTTCGLEESLKLKLAPEFGSAVSLPTCEPADDANLSWQEQFTLNDHELTGTRSLKLKTIEFSPAAYLKLKQALRTLEYDGRKAPILTLTDRPATDSARAMSAPNVAVASDAKILESTKTLTFTDAHHAEMRTHYVKQILSYNGKKRESELKIEYNPATQDARLIRGTVVSKDGRREEISPGEINVMDTGWNASAKRYTGSKFLVANLPDVEIGSTIEVEFALTWHDRPFIANTEAFQFPDDLAVKTLTVSVPAGMPLLTRVTGPEGVIQASQTQTRGTNTYVWTAKNVSALPAEQGLPPAWLWQSGLHLFAGDAKDYYQKLSDTLLARAAADTHAAAQASQLIANSTNRLAALRAIRDFVAENIRPAGPALLELPLDELSTADTTLADGYGHAADHAILLYAMLQATGFHPEFVLASDLPELKAVRQFARSYPMPTEFQTPLVRVRVEGQTYYLNDTDQYAELGTTPHDGNLAVLPRTGELFTLAAAKNDRNRSETGYDLAVTDTGTVRVTVSTRYYGTDYNAQKQYFAELPPEERRRYFQELVSGFSQSARPVGGLITQFETYPGLVQYTVEAEKYAVVDGRYLYFTLPFTPTLFPAGADRRQLPLYAPEAGTETLRADVTLPSMFSHVIIAPPDEKITAPGGRARLHSHGSGGHYEVIDTLEHVPAIIAPDAYPQDVQAEARLQEKSTRLFLLEKP